MCIRCNVRFKIRPVFHFLLQSEHVSSVQWTEQKRATMRSWTLRKRLRSIRRPSSIRSVTAKLSRFLHPCEKPAPNASFKWMLTKPTWLPSCWTRCWPVRWTSVSRWPKIWCSSEELVNCQVSNRLFQSFQKCLKSKIAEISQKTWLFFGLTSELSIKCECIKFQISNSLPVRLPLSDPLLNENTRTPDHLRSDLCYVHL